MSPDGNLLAYTTDETGFRQYTLHVKDLRTGKLGPEAVPRVTAVEWAEDGKTLFYSVEHPQTKRSHQVFRHVLGERQGRPPLRGEGRALQRLRLEVAGPQVPVPRVRAAIPRPRSASSPPTARGGAEADRRRAQPDHEYDVDHRDGDVLDPHQRQGPQLPAGDGARRGSRRAPTGRRSCRTATT